MSQSGRPFDDSLGDASGVAPYDDSSFALMMAAFGNFVIPETTTAINANLNVYAGAAAGQVRVATGKAWAEGTLYHNIALPATLSFDAAVNNRIDRVVLRKSDAGQTVRLTIIKGTEAANPAPPNLAATDMPLARIWLPAGFNPAADMIADTEIHDERVFFPTGEHENLSGSTNLMPNSEFLGLSHSVVWPVGWVTSGGPPTGVLASAPLTNQPRGRSIRVQTAADGRGMQTVLRVGIGMYTLRGTLNITSGTSSVVITLGGSGYTATKNFNRTGANVEYIIRFYSDRQQDLTIALLANTAEVYFGQVLLSRGYCPGYYGHKHELIMLDNAITDANWTATAKSTGSTLINLNADFLALFGVAQAIRGVILRLQGNDSGSSGGADVAKIAVSIDGVTPLSILRLGRVPNDDVRSVIAFAPMLGGLGTVFYLDVTATGAGTLDATVEIIGIIT